MGLKDFYLAVSAETATLLYLLARSCHAASIVEFGTSFGVSALHFAAAGLDDLIEIRAGDTLETLARDLPEAIDLVLFDGAKAL